MSQQNPTTKKKKKKSKFLTVLNRPEMQKKTVWNQIQTVFSGRFKTVQYMVSLNKFLDGLGKTVRNSRRFDPNRLETVLDGFAQNHLGFSFFFFFFSSSSSICYDYFLY
jgi:repressor of nif and glnA expression